MKTSELKKRYNIVGKKKKKYVCFSRVLQLHSYIKDHFRRYPECILFGEKKKVTQLKITPHEKNFRVVGGGGEIPVVRFFTVTT